jgi:hypothetical protein
MFNVSLPQRTTAIYGSAETQAATLVPSLDKAADGTNLIVQANVDELNKDQTLILDDLIYETTTIEVYPQTTAPGNVAILGSNMFWTNTQDYMLEIEFIPSQTITGAIPATWQTSANPFFNGAPQNPSRAYDTCTPQFAMLTPFIRCNVQMGENNMVIGRQPMQQIQGVLFNAQDNKITPEQAKYLGQVGLPNAQCGLLTNYAGTGAAPNSYTSAETSPNNIETLHQWDRCLKDIINVINSVSTATSTLPLRFTVPLWMLNSFFKQKSYLPPGLKYRIELQYQTTAIPIVVNSLASGIATQQQLNIQYTGNFRLVYRGNQLRAEPQREINEKWIQKPFLFNYETYEYIEYQLDGVSTSLYKDIAISQQRPTEIVMKVVNTGPNTGAYSGYNETLFTLSDMPVIFSNVKVDVAGRLQYYLRTPQFNSTPANNGTLHMDGFKDASELLNCAINENTYQEFDKIEQCASRMRNIANGTWLKISTNPGDNQRNGYISTDAGAVVMRVEMNLTDPLGVALPAYAKLVIFKKLPEQLEIDANRNINIIQWPAVKTNTTNTIQNTYNMN